MDNSKSVPARKTIRNKPLPTMNIVDTLIASGHSTTFVACICAAGLTDVFSVKGPFTIFVPTDDAFKRLPSGACDALLQNHARLKDILNYHVVPGYHMRRDFKSGEVMTQQGTTLTATASFSGLRVNGASVTQADGVATNGIIHSIDAVILPNDWQLLVTAA
jgi:uncharacterized surface protein with fasciclin (FAS1) repeats